MSVGPRLCTDAGMPSHVPSEEPPIASKAGSSMHQPTAPPASIVPAIRGPTRNPTPRKSGDSSMPKVALCQRSKVTLALSRHSDSARIAN